MSQLLAENRREQILDELRRRGTVRISDLAATLDAAPVTVRRDIRQLADEGLIRRVHGGAALVSETPTSPPASPTAVPEPETPTLPAPAARFRVGMLAPSLDYYWPGVIQGVQAEAEERGIQLLLRGTSYESSDDRAQITHLLNSGVDGVLAAPDVALAETHDTLAWLRAAGVPVVLVEREASHKGDRTPFESVNTDHDSGARSAVCHLVELGHRRIGIVLGLSPHAEDVRRGYRAALEECGLDRDVPERLLTSPGSFETVPELERVVQDCLDGNVTALLVHADREAIAIAQYCQRHGISIPDDLSIVSYDDEIAGLFSPPLTAVRPPRTSIGRAALALMAERLRDPERPIHRVIVTPKLSIRQSSAPPRG